MRKFATAYLIEGQGEIDSLLTALHAESIVVLAGEGERRALYDWSAEPSKPLGYLERADRGMLLLHVLERVGKKEHETDENRLKDFMERYVSQREQASTDAAANTIASAE